MGGRVTLYCMWPATASEDSVDEWSPGSTVPWLRGAHLILWGGQHKNLFTTDDCFHCHKSVWNQHPFLLRFLKCNIVFSIRHWRAKSFFFSIMKYTFSLLLVIVICLQLEAANTEQTKPGQKAQDEEQYAKFTITLTGTPNQTRPQAHFVNSLLCSSQSLKAETTFTNPCIPGEQACTRTK